MGCEWPPGGEAAAVRARGPGRSPPPPSCPPATHRRDLSCPVLSTPAETRPHLLLLRQAHGGSSSLLRADGSSSCAARGSPAERGDAARPVNARPPQGRVHSIRWAGACPHYSGGVSTVFGGLGRVHIIRGRVHIIRGRVHIISCVTVGFKLETHSNWSQTELRTREIKGAVARRQIKVADRARISQGVDQ